MKVTSSQFQRCVKQVSRLFEKSIKGGSRKSIKKKIARVFQECFNEVLFCNFVLAWISLKLPEQKKGLF